MIKEMHVCILPTGIMLMTSIRKNSSTFTDSLGTSSKKLFIRSTRQRRIQMVSFQAVAFFHVFFARQKDVDTIQSY